MTPGQDWAMAVRSMTSFWSIHPSSSTNFFWRREMMTMPPPKVQALMRKQVLNRVQSLFLFFMRQNEFSMADDSPFGCLLRQMQGIIGTLG